MGYRDGKGAIWDSWWDPSSSTWELQEISEGGKTSGPAAISGPFIGVFSNQQHFAYIDGSGNIWDSYYGGNWYLQKINNGGKTSGPAAVSSNGSFDVSVWVWAGSQQHFSYLGAGGVIYDAYYFEVTGKWYLQQINAGGKTRGPASVSPPFACVFLDQQHFVYQDAEGQIWDSYYDATSTGWTLQKINNGGVTNAPLAASGGQPFVWVDPSGKQQHFTYRGVDSAVYDIYYGSGNQWTLQKITNGGLTPGPGGSELTVCLQLQSAGTHILPGCR